MLKRLNRKFATTDYVVKSIQVASKRVLLPTSLCLTAFNLIRVIEKATTLFASAELQSAVPQFNLE